MPSKKNLVNQQFGYLTVIEESEIRKNNRVTWKCECNSPNHKEPVIIYCTTADLMRKNTGTKSCGCLQKEKVQKLGQLNAKDMMGKKIGKLTVISRAYNIKSEKVYWNCQCDCGKNVIVSGDHLRSGHTTSCGCLKNIVENIIGNTYNNSLEVIGPHKKINNKIYWQCKCLKCNDFKYIRSDVLKNSYSCGCEKSIGESLIKNILENNNIQYIHEYSDLNLKFDDTGRPARFDFFINDQYYIEFDGSQHFSYTDKDWNTQEKFKKTQQHDKIKNEYCLKNNIPLIRIPYWHISKLSLEDLLVETSKFLITEVDENNDYD